MRKHIVHIVLLVLILGAHSLYAQQLSGISGRIVNANGEPVANATIEVLGKSLTTYSNMEGYFEVANVTEQLTLKISSAGYITLQKTITANATLPLHIQLIFNDDELAHVTVTGRSGTTKAEEQAIKAAVVNVRKYYEQPATLNEVLNRSAGIRVRQSGGLGGAPEIAVNGFQGRSVRYFKDGVPMDYLRNGYNIANVPVNALDRIEVYKGVLPVSLGSDALGGAANLVTRTPANSYGAVSYEIASFNTHRFTLNGFYKGKNEKWFAGVDAFYNYSDNNYKATVKVTDPVTRNQRNENVPLFHNGFKGYYAELYGGITNVNWADELRFSVAALANTREQQHPALMTDPFGAILGKQSSIVPSVRYKKTLFTGKLMLDQFLVMNTFNIRRTDTLRGVYDWYGNFTPIPGRLGESRQPSLSDINFKYFTSRTNARLNLSSSQALEFNYVFNGVARQGEDRYGARFHETDIDVLSPKATYQKQILGVGWDANFLKNTINNYLMAKFYRYHSSGVDAWNAREVHLTEEQTTNNWHWGIGNAVKVNINQFSFIRLSGEYAYRLPEQDELFGDAVWTVTNFSLLPERSANFNLGYRIRKGRIAAEINSFYRRTKDMILLVPVQAPYAQFQNMENVKGFGFDADFSIRFLKNYSANVNATWQDLRLTGFKNPQDQWKENARLRNTPYFFANAGVNAAYSSLFKKEDLFKAYVHYNFIREFYLETIPKRLEAGGFLGLSGSANIQSELLIPSQHLLTAGVNYNPAKQMLQLGFEVKNITNASIYDYYRVQRAGRSFHFKISYQFNNSKNK